MTYPKIQNWNWFPVVLSNYYGGGGLGAYLPRPILYTRVIHVKMNQFTNLSQSNLIGTRMHYPATVLMY